MQRPIACRNKMRMRRDQAVRPNPQPMNTGRFSPEIFCEEALILQLVLSAWPPAGLSMADGAGS